MVTGAMALPVSRCEITVTQANILVASDAWLLPWLLNANLGLAVRSKEDLNAYPWNIFACYPAHRRSAPSQCLYGSLKSGKAPLGRSSGDSIHPTHIHPHSVQPPTTARAWP